MKWAVVLVLLAACEKKPPPPTPTIPAPQSDAATDVAVAPSFDATVGPDVVTADWPTAIEIIEVATAKSIDVTHTHFELRTRPPELGNAMNAWMAKFAKLAKSKRTAELSCTLTMSSRIAVVGFCTHMNEMDDGGGGAPAGPEPTYFAWWMQPGLPPISVDQLAPGVDLDALFKATYAAAPKDCPLDHCTFTPQAFVVDREGIRFEPAEYCYPDCLRPTIALDDLRPTHPWGAKLVAWIRERNEAGEPVVTSVVKP